MIPTQIQQRRFVIAATGWVSQEISRQSQQLGPLLQSFMGEPLGWRPINAQLQGAQHGFRLSGGANAQKAEMIDRQFHLNLQSFLWLQTVGRTRVFAH